MRGKWIRHNVNPRNIRAGDCAIRAFSHASGRTWEQTLRDLVEIALDIKREPTEVEVLQRYATDLGFTRCKADLVDGKRPRVVDFAERNPRGVFILRVAHHVVVVKNGHYYDTWDCGNKCIYFYWRVG